MGELTGELIEMNAHMEVTKGAEAVMAIGVVLFIAFCLFTMACWPEKKNRLKYWGPFIAMLFMTAIAAGMVVYGAKMPRQKIIHACVNGPISLELISSRYDILKVDGKELTLKVRGS